MSTGKETALSAGTCSLGTNSSSGSGPGGGAGEAAGEDAGLGASWGAAAAGATPEPDVARSASSTSDTLRISMLSFPSILRLRVAGDAEAHVGPCLRGVVTVAQPQLRDRALQIARAQDDVQLSRGRVQRIALERAVGGRDGIDVLHPLRHVAPEVEEAECVGRKATDGRRDGMTVVVSLQDEGHQSARRLVGVV